MLVEVRKGEATHRDAVAVSAPATGGELDTEKLCDLFCLIEV